MTLLNTAENVYLGTNQVDAIYKGSDLVWQKPIGFPSALLDAYGRAYDVNMANNCVVTINTPSSNVALLGESVGCFLPVSENRIEFDGTTAPTSQSRLNGNTTGPTLSMVGGRRALTFNGTTDEYAQSATGANATFFLAATMGALIYTDANTVGTIFSLYRSEYGGTRTLFALDAASGGGAFQSYARLDGSTMVNNNGTSNIANTIPEGWKTVWFEIDLGTGNGDTGGSFYSEIGSANLSLSFTTSIGADASDGLFSRVTLGGRLTGTSPSNQFKGSIAKFFWSMKKFSPTERETLKQWLRSTKYLSPT